ncbi:TatD family deoxyribonuclease [Puteibacter caeruleilacunae]|nr:TatD family deoxyribonuclease [Puteibacter caeruleilacunae]
MNIQYIDIHTHSHQSTPNIFKISNILIIKTTLNPHEYIPPFSVGIHPWHINESSKQIDLDLLFQIASSSDCVAIGEIGLDKVKGPSIEIQLDILHKQLQTTEKLMKPVILHCVKAYDLLAQLRKQLQPIVPWIIHGFNGSEQLALQLVKQGFYLSFGHQILNPKSKASKTFINLPLDYVFFETDENEASIAHIYQQAARLKSIDENVLKDKIRDNFIKVFGDGLVE